MPDIQITDQLDKPVETVKIDLTHPSSLVKYLKTELLHLAVVPDFLAKKDNTLSQAATKPIQFQAKVQHKFQLGNTNPEIDVTPTGQAKIRVGSGTDSGGIAQTNALRGGSNVQLDNAAIVVGRATERDGATAGGAAQILNLDVVAIEDEDAVQIAEAARKIAVTEKGVFYVQAALEDGLLKSAGRIEVHPQSATGQNFWIQGLPEGHIDGAVEAEIHLLRARQMRPAMRREVGTAAAEMKRFDDHRLIDYLKPDRFNAVHLDLLDFCAEAT